MEGQQTASAALQQADSGESISRLSASASKADKQREKNERKLQAKKQHAAVTYPESLDGASLTYDVKGSSLKESLILKKLTGRKSYSFKIEAEGLRAEVQADSSVHFYAEGTEDRPLSRLPLHVRRGRGVQQRGGRRGQENGQPLPLHPHAGQGLAGGQRAGLAGDRHRRKYQRYRMPAYIPGTLL